MKQKIILLSLLSTMVLSGCSSISNVLNKNIGEEAEVDFSQMSKTDMEEWALTNDLSRSIYDKFVSLKEVSTTQDVTFTMGEQTSKKNLTSLEYYTEDGLQKAYFNEVILGEDQIFPREYYVETETNEGKVRYNQQEWQDVEEMGYRQPTYITVVKVLLDRMEESHATQEGDETKVEYHIDDAEYVKEMIPLFNPPIMISQEATGNIDVTSTVNKDGFITDANITVNIADGPKESTYQTQLTFEPQLNDTLEAKLDQQPEPTPADKDNFVKIAEENHHLQTLETYDYTVHAAHGDKTHTQYYLLNLINQTPVYGVTGEVEDKEIQDQDFMTDNYRYSFKDDQIEAKEHSLFNIYDRYVRQFKDIYKQLEYLEIEEEMGQPQRGYRKLYENDFEGFKQASKGMNSVSLKKDGEAIYGVDYYIDQETFRLTNVIFWSIGEGEEEVSDIITLQFGMVNEVSPFAVGYNVDEQLWQEMKKLEGTPQE